MSAALHDLALPTFHRWAARWDWAVRAVDLPSDGAGADPAAQAAKWVKTRLLRQALRQHPYALWLDADVLLLRSCPAVLFTSRADSYADRPTVPSPHALHFMGMAPQARYRHMAAVAAELPAADLLSSRASVTGRAPVPLPIARAATA